MGILHHAYIFCQWQNRDVYNLLLRQQLHDQLFLIEGPKADAGQRAVREWAKAL